MIRLPAYFTRFGSKTDGSASLGFATQELSPEDFALLKQHLNQFGWVVFKENDVSESDIPDENAEEEGISASERLRRRCFVYWKDKVNDNDFNSWYRKYLESIGEKLLERLN